MASDNRDRFRPSLFDDPFFFEGSWRIPWDSRKPTAELVRELFDLRDLLPDKRADLHPDGDLYDYFAEQLRAARSEIGRIQEEATARAELHKQSIVELDYQITQAASSLEHFSTW